MTKTNDTMNTTGPFHALLDIEGIAAFLNVPIKAAYGLVQVQDFPAFKIGKHWRCHPVQLDQWARVCSRDRIDATLTV